MKYQIVVGNVGTVKDTDNQAEALYMFEVYKAYSQTNYGRTAGEDVTLLVDGEPVKEYYGHNEG